MTSMRLVHRISDVACVELDVTRRSDTQPDYSKFISGVGMKHPEVIRRNLVDRVNAIFEERQQQFTVLQQSRLVDVGVEKRHSGLALVGTLQASRFGQQPHAVHQILKRNDADQSPIVHDRNDAEMMRSEFTQSRS